MKRTGIICLCLMVVIGLFGLTGCGEAMPYSEIKVDDYVKLGEYKGLKADPINVEVTKEDVANLVQARLNSEAEEVNLEKGDKIKNGDVANINYVGTINGKEFEGGSADNYDLTIGSGDFISGFEDGLVGKKVGQENIKLNLAFPLNYGATDLAGKDVVFTVKINSAVRPTAPEYNEVFIKSQGDYNTKEEYEAALKEELTKKQTAEAKENQKNALWSQVISNSEVKKYPEEVLNTYLEFNSKQLDDYAEEAGVTRKDILEQYGFASEEEFKNVNEDSSKVRVKQELIMKAISEKENLEVTDKAMEDMVKKLEEQGYTDEAILQSTGRNITEYVYLQVMYENVLDFIVKNADISK
ncbi:MAG: trigger factor [Firmicutes bacterium]|nr:trigger factor [Bacillota bacterium]